MAAFAHNISRVNPRFKTAKKFYVRINDRDAQGKELPEHWKSADVFKSSGMGGWEMYPHHIGKINDYQFGVEAERQKLLKQGYIEVDSKENPSFLPKRLFDRYDIKTSSGETLKSGLQTLSGARSQIRKQAKRKPCDRLKIVSQQTGKDIEVYKPGNGGVPQVDTNREKEYKREIESKAKEDQKFELQTFDNGRWEHYATYDTRKEAQDEAKDVMKSDRKLKTRVVPSKQNPSNPADAFLNYNGWELHESETGLTESDVPHSITMVHPASGQAFNTELVDGRVEIPDLYDREEIPEDVMELVFKQYEKWGGTIREENPSGRRRRRNSLDSAAELRNEKSVIWITGERRDGKLAVTYVFPGSGVRKSKIITKERLEEHRASGNYNIYRKNPEEGDEPEVMDSPDEAAALYEEFHGVPSEQTEEYVTEEFHRTNFAGLGQLCELIVTLISTGKEATITASEEETEKVQLASSPDGRQLFFIGGDQSIDLDALGFEQDDTRDHMLIGVITELTYRTKKTMHKLKLTEYFHGLGEESGNQPMLEYKPLSQSLSVIGGSYHVEPEGITD